MTPPPKVPSTNRGHGQRQRFACQLLCGGRVHPETGVRVAAYNVCKACRKLLEAIAADAGVTITWQAAQRLGNTLMQKTTPSKTGIAKQAARAKRVAVAKKATRKKRGRAA